MFGFDVLSKTSRHDLDACDSGPIAAVPSNYLVYLEAASFPAFGCSFKR